MPTMRGPHGTYNTCQCMARITTHMSGIQCSRSPVEGYDLCRRHLNHLPITGRMDEIAPAFYPIGHPRKGRRIAWTGHIRDSIDSYLAAGTHPQCNLY